MKKHILLLFSSAFLITCFMSQNNIAHAETVNDTTPIDRISQMQNQVHQKNKAKVISVNDKYIKITNYDNGQTKSEAFDKSGYISERTKEYLEKSDFSANPLSANLSVANPVQGHNTYSWIRITTELDYAGPQSTYYVYGYYSWLVGANNRKTDVIGLSHDSNVSFYGDNYAESHNYYYWDNSEDHLEDISLNHNSDGFKTDVNGIAFPFTLNYYSTDINHLPYGMISTRAQNTSYSGRSCNISCSYAHQETYLTIKPDITFPGGPKIVVEPETKFDNAACTINANLD